jgi:hypothetical protein
MEDAANCGFEKLGSVSIAVITQSFQEIIHVSFLVCCQRNFVDQNWV